MKKEALAQTARALCADGKGILAMDESNGTSDKRFAALGIAQTVEKRRDWRELILTAPGLGESIAGVILFDETMRQGKADGTPFLHVMQQAGILPGIKVDTGAKDLAGFPGEKITEGLDGLRERLREYANIGARFAKWRAVIAIGGKLPSWGCIKANAHALARFAALCQEAGLVPIVEPEVVMGGDHTLEQCQMATEEVLRAVFGQLAASRVALEGIILKPGMVVAGLECPDQPPVDAVADATVETLLRTVPAVAFLSGGQTAQLATARLNTMNSRFAVPRIGPPWDLSFSFARAIQQPALEIWRGQAANIQAAQQALTGRARLNRLARQGAYDASMECQ